MKKILLSTLLALLPIMASAYGAEIDGIYYNFYRINSPYGYVEVTSGDTDYSGSVVIPETITYREKNYNVTGIGNLAFDGCRSLTSVTIPNSVTSIGGGAFYNCHSLTSVTIPNSVTSIGGGAFYNCYSLTSVTIPNGVTSIGYSTFYDCEGLTSITIPNSVTSIDHHAFCGCTSLTSVTIPNSVTSIGGSAFYYCLSLTSVTIPNSVTSIADWAFCVCPSLTSVTIPNSVTSIGTSAFCACSGLTSVTIPESVTSIDDFAFADCSSLSGVYCLAENLPTTGSSVFDNVPTSTATLYVPASTLNEYKTTGPWSNFGTIVGITQDEIDGIKEIIKNEELRMKNEEEWYDLNGRKLVAPQKGINIIRHYDGTTRKVLQR